MRTFFLFSCVINLTSVSVYGNHFLSLHAAPANSGELREHGYILQVVGGGKDAELRKFRDASEMYLA